MPYINWKFIAILAVVVLCLLVMALATPADAASVTTNATISPAVLVTSTVGITPTATLTGSYVIVSEPVDTVTTAPSNSLDVLNDTFSAVTKLQSSMIPNFTSLKIHANNGTRITQGQCIEIGGYYDISGVIGFSLNTEHNTFAYYNQYEDAFDPSDNESFTYKLVMPDNRKAYYNFFVDPKIFDTRKGYWYQYDVNYERSANKRAFFISDRCIQSIGTTQFVDQNDTPIVIQPKEIPIRHISDVVVANDDPVFLNKTINARVWEFGTTKSILARDVNISANQSIFSSIDVSNFNLGTNRVLLETAGKNGIYELGYAKNERGVNNTEFLLPAMRSVDPVEITGWQPSMVMESVEEILTKHTDDTYLKLTMEVQEPFVEISGYQELRVGNETLNATLLEVTGYTNKVPGTKITLYVDRENQTGKSVKYPAMTIDTDAGNIGDYRTFHGYFPLFYDQISPGQHSLTAVLQSGKYSTVPFYIREEPKPMYTQPVYYKFVDGNPFYEPPTPVIITKEVVKEVTKIQYETVIQKEEVDYETLAKTELKQMIPIAAAIVIVGIPLFYIVWNAIRTYAKRKLRKINGGKL